MINVVTQSIPPLKTTVSDPIAVRLFNLEQRNEYLEGQNADLRQRINTQGKFWTGEDGVPHMGDPAAPRLPYERLLKRGKLLPGAGYLFAGWWQAMKDYYVNKVVE